MKKRTLSAGILTAMMMISPIAGNTANALTLTETSTKQTTQQLTQKIMWGANELADTQIGRITFLKDTKLYKRNANNLIQFHLNAKKGSMWRVHKITKEGNMNVYDLGGGVRVQQSNLSKYEAVPTALIEKQVKENGVHISWDRTYGFDYPQARRLASKEAEENINNDIRKHVIRIAMIHGIWNGSKEFSVLENKDNRLAIVFRISYTDTDGELVNKKGTTLYDVTTGMIIEEKIE